MTTEIITLRQDHKGDWRLYAPKGHEMCGPFHGTEWAALEWSRAVCSNMYNWQVKLERKIDAQQDQLPEPTIRDTRLQD